MQAKPTKTMDSMHSTQSGEAEEVQSETTALLAATASPVPYTIFSSSMRAVITFIVGAAFFFSPLSANIYFPCIPALQRDLNASPQLINLTITAYVAMQGISPAFFGDLADSLGRRPVFLLTFVIYVTASVALALQNSYAGLLVLRMLQSAGCSATAAIGYGVVADVAMLSERGKMLGRILIVANLGPTFGPLLGGLLADKAGWRSVVWFMAILGGVFLLLVSFSFPETARHIVGNGCIPASKWNRPLLSYRKLGFLNKRIDSEGTYATTETPQTKILTPNPLKAVRIIFHRDAAHILFISAIFYAAYYCVQASMPNLFMETNGFNELQIGLSYLAIGIGVAFGGYVNGKLVDHNYRSTAKRSRVAIESNAGDDLMQFPIEEARARTASLLIGICTFLLVLYGWVLEKRTHVSAAFILHFLLGFITTCIVQTFNTLLVDIFPANPSTAAASGNITRCALSAAAVAAMQPLLGLLGRGWFFALLGGSTGLSGLAVVQGIRKKGMKWRKERMEREASKRTQEEANGRC